MDLNRKKIGTESQVLKQKRDQKVQKIVKALNSPFSERCNENLSQNNIKDEVIKVFETIKDNLNEKIIGRLKYKIPLSLPPATTIILPLLIGILAYFICCFCGQDECYGPVFLALPVITKKAFCWTFLKYITLFERIPCEEEIRIWTDSELIVVFQEDDSKFNLLFPLAFVVKLSIVSKYTCYDRVFTHGNHTKVSCHFRKKGLTNIPLN